MNRLEKEAQSNRMCYSNYSLDNSCLVEVELQQKNYFGHFMSINGKPRKNGKNAALQRSAMFIENISTYSRTPAECYV